MPKTFLIVPCFNEAKRLPVAEFVRLLSRRPELVLLFVDDGSTDGTGEVIASIQSSDADRVLVHRLERNCGKAEAVRQGLRLGLQRGASIVGYTDADLSTPATELELLLDEMDVGAAALLGARVRLLGRDIQRRPHRHYLGRIFATIASFALGVSIYDTQCGAKLFRRTDALVGALRTSFRSRWIFDVELLARLLRGTPGASPLRASDIVELPLRSWRDVAGSKLRLSGMFRAAADLILLTIRLRCSPSLETPASPTLEPDMSQVRADPPASAGAPEP